MAYNEQAKKATLKYIKDKMQQFTIRFKQSDYDERIKPAIEASGLKPTTFIKKAIDEKIARDSIAENSNNE
jgi:predicted DNA binding CopG/RHH family protein